MNERTEHLERKLDEWPPLTKTYEKLLDELAKPQYEVRSVFEHYIGKEGKPHPKKITIVLRVDVDAAFHLSYPLALHFAKRKLNASHYFLTNETRYYNLWNSQILSRIQNLGQEVGLHSDHYFAEMIDGFDGLESIRKDVANLGKLTKAPIFGMTYHGHIGMDTKNLCNAELYQDVNPKELGLVYHDGRASCYCDPMKNIGEPKCASRVIDFMGLPSSWGWNYIPWYPLAYIKKHAKVGHLFCVDIHTLNAFEYWKDWPTIYGEKLREKESSFVFFKKVFLISSRLYLLPKLIFIARKLRMRRIVKYFYNLFFRSQK